MDLNGMEKGCGLYVHVPFCRRKCAYCDFYSGNWPEKQDAYVQALLREMETTVGPKAEGRPKLRTVYFGGGTPSLLTAPQRRAILRGIRRLFDLSDCLETTLEANPDDLSDSFLRELREEDFFHRISIGCQSFQDSELQAVGRRHTARQALDAVRRCRDKGFDNLSIDLMMGLPGQTPESFHRSLEAATDLGVQHISAYMLSLEPQVPLARSLEAGQWREADEDTLAALYGDLCKHLSANGFEHYEISNFALPGYRSLHNSSYWQGIPYWGFGPGAHSYFADADSHTCIRRWNGKDIGAYLSGNPKREEERLSLEERFEETVMTELRTSEGLDLDRVRQLFGEERLQRLLQKAQPLLERRLLLWGSASSLDCPPVATHTTQPDRGHLRLAPDALLISDRIICELSD